MILSREEWRELSPRSFHPADRSIFALDAFVSGEDGGKLGEDFWFTLEAGSHPARSKALRAANGGLWKL